MPVQVPTKGKLGGCPVRKAKREWAKKLPKRGVKNHQKYPKRGAKLINEEVTTGTKGMIFQGKKFLEEKLQKNFRASYFYGRAWRGHTMNNFALEGVKWSCTGLG